MILSRRRALMSVAAAWVGGVSLARGADGPAAPVSRARRPSLLDGLVSVSDFEPLAERKLSPMSRALVRGGAADEITVRWNREAFDAVALKPRVLVNVSKLDTRVSLPGAELDFPILLAPTAYHRMVHPGGEVETARGASEAGACLVVSSATNTRLDAIARVVRHPLWFQMYVQSDRGFVTEVVREVEAAGCRALMVTVDAPVVGPRYRQIRAHFKLTPGLTLPYMLDVNRGRDSLLRGGNTHMTWKDIDWLRSITRLPIWLKGILNPDDAVTAVEAGVAGIVVSNHGGRGLDTAPATLTALPRVAERVAGRVPILMDGGVRRGTDIVKAIASGAKAVMIGRPYLHGLAVGGGPGVARVVGLLRDELEQAMALTGRVRLADIDRGVLWG